MKLSGVLKDMPDWLIVTLLAILSLGYRIGLRSSFYHFLLKVKWTTSWKRAVLITFIGFAGDAFFSIIIVTIWGDFFYYEVIVLFVILILNTLALRFLLEVLLIFTLLNVRNPRMWIVGLLLSACQTIMLVVDLVKAPPLVDVANIFIFWALLELYGPYFGH